MPPTYPGLKFWSPRENMMFPSESQTRYRRQKQCIVYNVELTLQGGGIPRHITDHLFHYLYSTAPRPSMTPTKAPLAGYGYGLPLSRLYARYFHGDLILNSYDGYGTDAVVYLKTSTVEATELLPVFNKTSKKQYNSSIATADWTDPSFSGVNRGTNRSGH